MHRSTPRARQIFTSIDIDDIRARLRVLDNDMGPRPSTQTRGTWWIFTRTRIRSTRPASGNATRPGRPTHGMGDASAGWLILANFRRSCRRRRAVQTHARCRSAEPTGPAGRTQPQRGSSGGLSKRDRRHA